MRLIEYINKVINKEARPDVVWTRNVYWDIMNIFRLEKREEIEQVGERESFLRWCGGIPSVFPVEFATYRQIEILKELDEVRYVSNYRPDIQLFNLIYNELTNRIYNDEA